MDRLVIKTCITEEISNELWDSYVKNFNLVFKKNFNLKYFLNKYNSHNENSYHSFLIANDKDVVAAISIIPMNYFIDEIKKNIGLVVDLFVLTNYRNDPLIILKLYIELKSLIIKNKISAIVAVPNINSVNYFINILKFKNIGNLNYWIFPVNIGNIKFNNNKWINYFSHLTSYLNLALNYLLSRLFNSVQNNSKIFLDSNSIFIKKRFNGPYKKYIKNNTEIYYRIVNEDGIKTAYLLYFRYNMKTSYISLWKAINYIRKNENIDLILYVGSLTFFQLLLFKVPRFLEPKNLPFVCENINLGSDQIDLTNDFNNWDFGILNYDVR
jgi:hypothetical protein